MIGKRFKKIFEQAKTVYLLPEEKTLIKSRLVLFMQTHPVRNLSALSQVMQSWSEIIKPNLSIKSMIAILLIVTLLTGSTSALAETSLPGSPLYQIKVGVNEPIRTFLSFSSAAKADWNVKLAERRLVEAEKLAAKGELSAENKAEIETRFVQAVSNFKGRVEEVKILSNGLELSSDFEAALKAHQNILANLSVLKPSSSQEIKGLLVTVDLGAKQIVKIREAQEGNVATSSEPGFKAAAEGKLNAAENKLDEVAKFLSGHRANLEAEAYAEAEAKLSEAKLKINDGKTAMAQEKFGEAFAKFQEAIRIAQEAKLMVSSAVEFKIKLNGIKLEVESENKASSSLELDNKTEAKGELKVNGGLDLGF